MHFTKRQKQILDFISDHLSAYGYAPSLREIAANFGLSSVATVHQHVAALDKMGALSKEWNRSRSLRPVHTDIAAVTEVPILGNIAAGRPIPAIETLDDAHTIPVPENFLGRGEFFALRVEGDSMIEEGIHDQDTLIIRRQDDADNGQVVVALIDNSEATVKKLHKKGDEITLIPANPAFKPVTLPASRVRIQGVAVSLMRKYG
jgi:repressor LexA